MIKKTILVALAAIPFMALAQQDFTVKGKAGNYNKPAKVFMIYNNSGQRVIDSAEVKNGSFGFEGSVQDVQQAILVLDREGNGVQAITVPDMVSIYLESGDIVVNAADSLSKAEVSGTPVNVDQQKLAHQLKEVTAKNDKFMAKFQAANEEQRADATYMAAMNEEYAVIQAESQVVIVDFVKNHPSSMVSLMSIMQLAGPSPELEVIEPLLQSLSAELQATPQAQELAKTLELAKVVGIGSLAPVFTQNDTLGNPVSLESFRGKYVLLDFWASWCGPCRQENPNIVAAYDKYKDKNFTVLGISLDRPDDKEGWLKAIHDDKLTWTQVSDLKFWNNEVAQLYGIRSIPQSYLLDPEGRIIGKNLRGKELHDKLAELLK